VHGLLLAQPHNYTDALTAGDQVPPPRAVRLAMDLIQAQRERPWSTADLARAVAVSVRSLQQGFHRFTGVSPMAYLRHVATDTVAAPAPNPHPSLLPPRWSAGSG
jgi:transcriptional regulator GlxA family with amidase domain